MNRILRWLPAGLVVIAVLCTGLAGFSLAQQAYYTAAARSLAAAVQARQQLSSSPVPPAVVREPAGADLLTDSISAAVPTRTAPGLPAAATVAAAYAPGLIGQLDVPHLGIATAVVEGDTTGALRRGAGHVRGTALPGDAGNIVLAGHRDTVFRRLGELQRGDRVRLTTERGVFVYRVSRTLRVTPQDTWVVRRRAAALTLITCYPFNWIGAAPERWVVQAEPVTPQIAATADGR